MERRDRLPELAPALGFCVLLLAACGAEPTPPAADTAPRGAKMPAADEPAAPPPEARPSVAAAAEPRLLVGRRDANGELESQPGFEVGDAPAFQLIGGASASETLEVVWYGVDDEVIHRQSVPLSAGRSVRLDFRPPGGWQPGSYRVEAHRGEASVAEERFEIVENAVVNQRPGA